MNKDAQTMVLLDELNDCKTNHILHLILSVVTCGIWIPLWILISIGNAYDRKGIRRKLGRMGNV